MKNKKLSLNKEVIASFDNREISRVNGGKTWTLNTNDTCPEQSCPGCFTYPAYCTEVVHGTCGFTDHLSCPDCWTAGGGAPTAGPPTCECSDICGSPTIPTEFCPTNPQICIV